MTINGEDIMTDYEAEDCTAVNQPSINSFQMRAVCLELAVRLALPSAELTIEAAKGFHAFVKGE